MYINYRYLNTATTLSPAHTYSYRPSVTVSMVTEELAFESEEECVDFLSSSGAELDAGQRTLDCKASSGRIA